MGLRSGRAWLVRVPKGADLWEWLRAFLRGNGVHAGGVSVIGATTRAVLGFYVPQARVYRERVVEGQREILSCAGNVSVHEGAPFPHVHIVLGAEDGSCLGGHLRPGTTVFVGEAEIREYEGEEPVRVPDPELGLPLWKP